jgi:hypothetical protein
MFVSCAVAENRASANKIGAMAESGFIRRGQLNRTASLRQVDLATEAQR